MLHRLHEQLAAACPDCRAVEVKEKFGGLRVRIETAEGVADDVALSLNQDRRGSRV